MTLNAIERIGRAGALGEHWHGSGPDVFEITEKTIPIADDEVEIAVLIMIDERRIAGAPGLSGEPIEWIVGTCQFHVGGFGDGADVHEIAKGSAVDADQKVEVAVVIEIGKGWSGIADIEVEKRIDGSKDGRGGGADIDEIVDIALLIADGGIEIAVAINIREIEARIALDDSVERIGGAGALHVHGRRCGARVLKIANPLSWTRAYGGIEVAVAVDVRKDRVAQNQTKLLNGLAAPVRSTNTGAVRGAGVWK